MNILNENLINYYNNEKLLLENIDSYDAESYLIEAISSLISLEDFQSTSLLESIDFRYTEYMPLIEAVDEIKETQKAIKDTKKAKDPAGKENMIKKLTKQFNRVVEWWYKVDPDKKFRTLHLIIKIGINVIVVIAQFIVSAKLGSIAVEKVGGRYSNKLTRMPSAASTVGEFAIRMVISLIISKIISYVWELDYKVYANINKKDIDSNIKSFESLIKTYDKTISKSDDKDTIDKLKKARARTVNALAELNDIKYKLQKTELRDKKGSV